VKASYRTRERWLLLLVGVALVAVSVGTTLIASELVLGQRTHVALPARPLVSLLDAQLSCESYARKSLGKRVRLLSVDDHSSRLEASAGVYKMFFHGQLFAKSSLGRVLNEQPAFEHYLNCYVHMISAQVQLFEVVGDHEDKPEATRGSQTNAFGIKLSK